MRAMASDRLSSLRFSSDINAKFLFFFSGLSLKAISK
ncbi:hypothetical protein A2U01_0096962, partial [Trifolium medium]|nr:hypothetical protein [Trifolium medium]